MNLWRRVYDERKRVILPLGLVLAANVAVLTLAVLPLQTSVTTSEADAHDATMQLALARRLDKQAADARTSGQRADQELSAFYGTVLPHDLPTARKATTLLVEQAATDAGLRYVGEHFDETEIRDSRLSRAVSKVTLQGRYPDLRRFLYAVESAKEFIVVEKVEVAQTGDQPAANGTVQVSLVVSTYFLTAPHS